MSGPRGISRNAACQAISSYQHRHLPLMLTMFVHAEHGAPLRIPDDDGEQVIRSGSPPNNRRQAVCLYEHWIRSSTNPTDVGGGGANEQSRPFALSWMRIVAWQWALATRT